MRGHENIVLAISVGDINGIGLEVILKTFEDSRMLDFCTPVIFASTKTVSFHRKHLKISVNYNGVENASKIIHGKINIVNVWKENPQIKFGEETKDGGKFALLSLRAALMALKNDEVDVLVTAPINKHNIQSEEFNFPGHTDYLAKELDGEALMFMVTDNLKVGLLTDHVAVKEVSEHITKELVEDKALRMYDSLIRDFRIRRPKIAVLGVNPHSGDNGLIGNEDEVILKPVLKKLQESGKLIYGPYAADSFFGSDNYLKFDAVLASYHDQGLIPFKTLSFGQGVNFTAGLSKVRTSPDHGTAYEIAGKGVADYHSFREAVFTAIKIFKNRKEYNTISANPLKKQQSKS
jgi:4-hydroxythreonine-4-phosphate dehydrogenase